MSALEKAQKLLQSEDYKDYSEGQMYHAMAMAMLAIAEQMKIANEREDWLVGDQLQEVGLSE